MLDAEIAGYIQNNDPARAFELIAARKDMTAEEAYYLAYCGMLLGHDNHETITRFNNAEDLGFNGYWLYRHRAKICSTIGDHAGALRDALKGLASNPLPQQIDFAIHQMSLVAASTPGSYGAECSSLLSAIWNHVKKLDYRFSLNNRYIIKVNKGDFDAFVFQDDFSAQPAPGDKKLPVAPLTPDQFVAGWDRSQDLLLLLVAWYAAQRIPIAFLDIGANIGTDAIRVAKFTHLIAEQVSIAAFEPGVMAALVPRNLQLNGVEAIVRFEEKCVSVNDEPVLLFGESGLSVNNRIVNRDPSTEGFSKIVDAVTVSDYLAKAKFRRRHPILKIDTQGAEWLIWRGMKEEVPRRWFSMVVELTPWALRPTVAPQQFVNELLASFLVFDLGADRQRFVPITADRVEQVLAGIGQARPHWTDLLCISRELPSAQQLADRIATAHAGHHGERAGVG